MVNQNTTYTVYARYQKAANIIKNTTSTPLSKSDWNVVIVEPTGLGGKYGQKLSEITLPNDWIWVDENTTLTIGTQTYPARFDTTHYENLYDFSNFTGYDQNGHYVERYLSINTLKADSSISFSYNLSLDKV